MIGKCWTVCRFLWLIATAAEQLGISLSKYANSEGRMTKSDDRLRLLNAENAALWGVVIALRKAIAAETKLCDRFRPGIVVEMSKSEWKRQKPLYEAMADQHD